MHARLYCFERPNEPDVMNARALFTRPLSCFHSNLMVFNGPALSSVTVTCSCHVSREDGIVLRTTVLKKQIIKRFIFNFKQKLVFQFVYLNETHRNSKN